MKFARCKKVSLLLAVLVCLSVICVPVTLLAADVDLSLGAGAAMVPDYEGSEDLTGAPALFFSAVWEEGYFIKLVGPALRANVLPNKTWSLGPVLQYRGKRDDDVDNDQVENMRQVDEAIEAGKKMLDEATKNK